MNSTLFSSKSKFSKVNEEALYFILLIQVGGLIYGPIESTTWSIVTAPNHVDLEMSIAGIVTVQL